MTNYPATIARQMWLARLFANDQDRLDCIKRAWDYYEGRHPKPLVVMPSQVDDNVIVNLAGTIVNRGIAFLFGSGGTGNEVAFQTDATDATETPAEAYLDAVWADNGKMALLQEIGQNGFLAGYAAIKVEPTEGRQITVSYEKAPPDEAPEPPAMQVDPMNPPPPPAPAEPPKPITRTFLAPAVRLINLDPACLTLWHSPADVDDVYRYVIQYTADDERGNEVQYAQVIERLGTPGTPTWQTTNYRALGGAKAYRPDGPPTPWPYTIPPILHCKNLPRANCVYGYGDLDDQSLQDALNLVASSTRKTLRLFPDPQDVLFGTTAKGLIRGGQNVWGDLPKDARMERFEISSAALDAAHQHYTDLRSAIHAQASMPDLHSLDARQLGGLTNFGLRVLFLDLLNRNDVKRTLYGGLVTRACQLIALIGGFGEIDVAAKWPNPLPVNPTDAANEVTVKQKTGLVSDETLTTEMGYDYDEEQRRLATEEARNPPPPPTPPLAQPTPMDGTMPGMEGM